MDNDNSISFRVGTKKQRVLILTGFLSGAFIFVLKLCWFPIIRTILGNETGPDDQSALLSFVYRNLYWLPWCGAVCFILYGIFKKNVGNALAYVTGLVFSWVLFLLIMMVFFIFWGWRF